MNSGKKNTSQIQNNEIQENIDKIKMFEEDDLFEDFDDEGKKVI